MANKSISDIRTEMVTTFNDMVPTLDLSEGTPERDIFIEAPISGQLMSLWSQTNYNTQLLSPIINYQYLSDTDIESYCANFKITRIAATKSSGYALFYASSIPTRDISILAGTLISTTSSTPYYFEVTSSYYVSLANVSSYFNATNNRYEFSVYVEAQNAGSDYRAGSGTVTALHSKVTGIEGVTNLDSITGGVDAETNYTMLQRVVDLFQSRGLYNTVGVSNYARNSASSVLTVAAGDSLMERDGGAGGCVDVYIKGFTAGDQTDTFAITAEGLLNPAVSGYSSTYIKLTKPPVYTVSQVLINGVSILSSYYKLTVDTTSTVKKSSLANDKLELTDEGKNAITGFSENSTVSVRYSYNARIYTIKDGLTSASNDVMGRNYLVRELIETPISLVLYVAPSTGYTISDLSSTWNDVVSSYFNSLTYGASISASGINVVLKNISTMSGFDMTRIYFCTSATGTPSAITTKDPLVLNRNCYPTLGSVTYNQWISS